MREGHCTFLPRLYFVAGDEGQASRDMLHDGLIAMRRVSDKCEADAGNRIIGDKERPALPVFDYASTSKILSTIIGRLPRTDTAPKTERA